MPRSGPRMEQVAVRLDADTIAALDSLTDADCSRSDLLRIAIEDYLRGFDPKGFPAAAGRFTARP